MKWHAANNFDAQKWNCTSRWRQKNRLHFLFLSLSHTHTDRQTHLITNSCSLLHSLYFYVYAFFFLSFFSHTITSSSCLILSHSLLAYFGLLLLLFLSFFISLSVYVFVFPPSPFISFLYLPYSMSVSQLSLSTCLFPLFLSHTHMQAENPSWTTVIFHEMQFHFAKRDLTCNNYCFPQWLLESTNLIFLNRLLFLLPIHSSLKKGSTSWTARRPTMSYLHHTFTGKK